MDLILRDGRHAAMTKSCLSHVPTKFDIVTIPRLSPDPAILAFGERIRTARVSAGMSQTALGAAVGISFQQVQKYEKGADRMAASTLQGFATALGVHPGSFYNDTPVPDGNLADVKAALKIAKIAQRIQNQPVLRRIVALMEYFASLEDGEDDYTENGHGIVNDERPR